MVFLRYIMKLENAVIYIITIALILENKYNFAAANVFGQNFGQTIKRKPNIMHCLHCCG